MKAYVFDKQTSIKSIWKKDAWCRITLSDIPVRWWQTCFFLIKPKHLIGFVDGTVETVGRLLVGDEIEVRHVAGNEYELVKPAVVAEEPVKKVEAEVLQ